MKGYALQQDLYRGKRRVVQRAIRASDGSPVIVKSSLVDVPSEAEVAAVRHEFEILSGLAVDGVPTAHEVIADSGALHLVLEDRGGTTLTDILHSELDLAARLDIAIGLTRVLEEVHRQGVVHRDVNPSNVLVDENGAVTLIDFSISTRRLAEHAPVAHPTGLEGTLAYLSPEQTGRMNRPVDERSDFYCLGATLFELFTGRLPFEVDDPIELIYCHIAVPPAPIEELRPDLPSSIGAVIAKLLEKAPEDRYQSAAGILHDLRVCRNHPFDVPPGFRPGRRDVRDRFFIPRKLYGREAESRELIDAFDRASRGGVELALVAGYSGIGKSSLVHAVQTPVTERRGYFVSGKFDQLRLTVPYSAIVAALGELVAQLLTEPDDALQNWKRRLLEALGGNGQLVVDVIPDVEHVIGPQPPVPELGIAESRDRFKLVFRRFIGVFCEQDHPLVVFLDDLQWVDPASLALLETILTDEDSNHLLVIGAYRDNEVDDSHPLLAAVDSLASEARVSVSRMQLGPLGVEPVTELLLDTLHSERSDTERLRNLVLDKTAGNPFFLRQFLTTLYRKGSLHFDHYANRWKWDIDSLEAMDITTNVVDLMVARLEELPRATSTTVALAACIGGRFDVPTLELVASEGEGSVMDRLHPAIEAGLLVPDQRRRQSVAGSSATPSTLRFLHDRVQQAAYARLDDRAKREVHLRIGLMLEASVGDAAKSDQLFQIVDHLNVGGDLVRAESERRRLAALNLAAALRAVSATAYAAACTYGQAALDRLPSDAWESEYELTRDLHRVMADAEYLCGNFEGSQHLIAEMLEHLRTPVERAEVQGGLVVQQTLSGLYTDAIETSRQALELLGVNLPRERLEEALQVELDGYARAMGDRETLSLLESAETTEREVEVALQLLSTLLPLCYIADPWLCPVATARMVNLTLTRGCSADSAFGYAFFGLLHASVLEDPRGAYSFGQLAIALADRRSDARQLCRTTHVFCAFINHWSRHLREFDGVNRRGFQAGLQSGELQFAGYHRYNRALCLFHLGTPLDELVPELEELLRFSRRTRNQHATDPVVGVLRTSLELAGKTPETGSFAFEEIGDAEFQDDLESRDALPTIAHYGVLASQVLFLYGDVEGARRRSEQAAAHLPFISGHVSVALHEFYAALIDVVRAEGAVGEVDEPLSTVLERRLQRLQAWAQACPENFLHKALLVEAEIARSNGDGWQAAELFDQAIEEAGRNGFLHEEALARERAGLFWFERRRHKIAAVYLSEAHHGYRLWGASRKADRLAEAFGGLIAGARLRAPSGGATSMPFLTLVSSTGAALDFATVMKASRAISQEVDLDGLVKKLVRIAVETAGAQRGYLLLTKDDRLLVEASSDFEQGERRYASPIEAAVFEGVPTSVVNYVLRTKETLKVDDATEDARFNRDVQEDGRRCRSVLCVPILSRGAVAGLLYLEHSLAARVFTSDRVEILESLAAQAAISLVNAELYEERRKNEQILRSTLEEVRRLKGRLEQENRTLQEEIETQRSDEIVGESEAIQNLLQQIDLVAGTDANVLVLGESGTGKELVAREIHKRSARAEGPMIKVNCASVPRELYESEFFGHAKGAFTGASRDRAGRFEMADGGSLFLDEVGEIPLELQSKLLRVLQEAQFERVGEERTRSVNVRIIAATNRDLKREVAEGRFREDLYYRLNVIPIEVAPLRERKEDIPLLVARFVQMASRRMNRAPIGLSSECIEELRDHDWPGNVRELQNEVERALILSRSGRLAFRLQESPTVESTPTSTATTSARRPRTYADLKGLELEVVSAALEEAGWKVNGAGGAAEILGVKASTLFSRMKAMGIRRR